GPSSRGSLLQRAVDVGADRAEDLGRGPGVEDARDEAGGALDGLEGRAAELALRELEGARGVGGELLRGGDRAREELARVDDLVDEPGLAALVDAEDAAAEDDVAQVAARDAEAQDLERDGREGDADLELGRAKGRLAAREEAAVGGTGE